MPSGLLAGAWGPGSHLVGRTLADACAQALPGCPSPCSQPGGGDSPHRRPAQHRHEALGVCLAHTGEGIAAWAAWAGRGGEGRTPGPRPSQWDSPGANPNLSSSVAPAAE